MDNRLKTLALCMLSSATLANAQTFLSDTQAMKRIQTTNKYVLLPVEESENLAHIRVIKDNNVVKEFNCKLAVNKVDYLFRLMLASLEAMFCSIFNSLEKRKIRVLSIISLVGRN